MSRPEQSFSACRVLLLLGALALTTGLLPTAGRAEPASQGPSKKTPKTQLLQEQPAAPLPKGPDDLFEPLEADELPRGQAPSAVHRAVLLKIPNRDSANDFCEDDLQDDARLMAVAFESMIEHCIEGTPSLYAADGRRVPHYHARLRHAPALPAEPSDEPSPAYDAAARCFSADYVFALGWTPARDDRPASGRLWRYRREKGVEACLDIAIPTPGEEREAEQALFAVAREACLGVLPPEEEKRFPTVSPLVRGDKGLVAFARMRLAFDQGDNTGAWIAWEELRGHDPDCGRAALYALGFLPVLLQEEGIEKSMRAAVHAVRANPGDALLRGEVCLRAWRWFHRGEWARRGLEQALLVQPANFRLLLWLGEVTADNDRDAMAAWIEEKILPVISDGRAELELGNVAFNSARMEDAVLWYGKAREKMPHDHETALSLGLVATKQAERLARHAAPGKEGRADRERSDELFDLAMGSLAAAQDIDPVEIDWVYSFYVRAATRDYTHLPVDDADRERLFVTQAVLNGLKSTDATQRFERLARDVWRLQESRQREDCKNAEAGDPLYEMRIMARLQFALADDDTDEIVAALKTLRRIGNRCGTYLALIGRYAPLLDD